MRHAMAYVSAAERVRDELAGHPFSAELVDRLGLVIDDLHLAERHKARAAMALRAALYDAKNLGSEHAAKFLESDGRDTSI